MMMTAMKEETDHVRPSIEARFRSDFDCEPFDNVRHGPDHSFNLGPRTVALALALALALARTRNRCAGPCNGAIAAPTF